MVNAVVRWCLSNRFLMALAILALLVGGYWSWGGPPPGAGAANRGKKRQI